MRDKAIRVLLVDDEADLVSSLRKRLLRRGFTVIGTLNGAEAIAAAEERRFDVAIVDLKMPGMDGLEVLARLNVLQPTLQAIILTGHGSVDAAHRSGRLRAHSFLGKPAPFDELVELIERAYEEKRRIQRFAFEQELQEVVSSYRSPQEIMADTAHLRAKYEQ